MENNTMIQTQPLVLTISRQLGSGAAFIGQQLAERLGILYLDREILHQAALQLEITEETLQSYDERLTPLWQSLLKPFTYGVPETMYTPPPLNLPTDHDLFEVESKILSQVARTQSAVIIGRGGVHVLRNHPRHCSIFLHAPNTFRLQRIKDIYQLSDTRMLVRRWKPLTNPAPGTTAWWQRRIGMTRASTTSA